MALHNLMLTDSGSSGVTSSTQKKTMPTDLNKTINPKYTGGSTGGGNGGGSSSSSFSADLSYGGGGGYDLDMASLMAAQRAAAEEAYNRSMDRLNAAYNDTYASLRDNLNSSLETMRKNYEYGQGVQRDDAAKSLREAYINHMMNKRNLNQNLSAAGVSGGATESSMANMYNNYGNSRNKINTTLAENLAQLLNTYENNVAAAQQAYSSQWQQARQNWANQMNGLEQALAGNVASVYSGSSLANLANYAKTLADLTGNMNAAAESFTPTVNTLGINTVSTRQGNNMGSVTDYAKYLEMLEKMGMA